MSSPPIDPLKFASYGVKNPANAKDDKNKSLAGASQGQDMSPHKRQYPKDKGGNYDEWAALLLNQHETATKIQKKMDKQRREFMVNEFGEGVIKQHLAKKASAQHQQFETNVVERAKADERYQEHEYQTQQEKIDQVQNRKRYGHEVDTQKKQMSEVQNQMAQAEKAMALRLQEDRIRQMKQKEQEARQMRFEWRKNCDSSYERQIEEVRKKAQEEKLQVRTGPTTIGALGSNYEKQLQKLRKAEQRMDHRGAAVADVINAKKSKDIAAESRTKEDHGLIADVRMAEEQRRRDELTKVHAQENFAKGLQLKPHLRQSGSGYAMPESPSKRPATPTEEPSNEERAAIWQRIEHNIQKYKKDTQLTYKQMLDEQLQQKQMLHLQGNMTQMEKGMNKKEMKDFKGSSNNLNAMVPGMFNESPLRNSKISSSYKKEHVKFNSMRTSVAKERPGGHYNMDAPPGHWRPQHKRAVSQIALTPLEDPNHAPGAALGQQEQMPKTMKRESSFDQIFPQTKATDVAFNTVAGNKSMGKKINRTRLEQFNRDMLIAKAKGGPSSKAGASLLSREMKLTKVRGTEGMTSFAPTSMITQAGKQDQKRLKGQPMESIFKTEMESVKNRNDRLLAKGEDPESKKFGRWALSVLKDSAFSPAHQEQSRTEMPSVVDRQFIRERSAAQIKPHNYGVMAAPNEGNEKQLRHESRLRQMGLKDPEAARKMNGGKIIDQMQWHTDLMTADYATTGQNELHKVSQQARAHQLPLGGVLGERIAKQIQLYESNPTLSKAKPMTNIANDATDYLDMSQHRQQMTKPRHIDNSLQYSGMEITNVQSMRGLSQDRSANTINFESRSKSIDKVSITTSVARKQGLEGAIRDALEQRKRSQQGFEPEQVKKIPMRPSHIKKTAKAAAK